METHTILDGGDIRAVLESLLFVAVEPVETGTLAALLEIPKQTVEDALSDLALEYRETGRGIQLRHVAGGWRMYTHPDNDDRVRRFVQSWDAKKLSTAALETLAVIAYTQPATREGVRAVRGVNSDSAIGSLVDRGLVKEVGHKGGGGAVAYGTTKAFLERFGLRDLSELPSIEEFAPDERTRQLIRERLGGQMNATNQDESETRDND